MGNTSIKDLENQELGRAYLDRSSPKVISSDHVTVDTTKLRCRNDRWFVVSKDEKGGVKESLSFSVKNVKIFKSGTRVILDDKDQVITVLRTESHIKSERILLYRPTETFQGQSPTPEVYKVDGGKDLPMYLYACTQTLGVSKCDAGYCLLKVNEIYNDEDFAKFVEPIYKASKAKGLKFAAAITDGTDPSNLLGKLTVKRGGMEVEIGDGVDIIAAICVGTAVKHFGKSAGGLSGAGVV